MTTKKHYSKSKEKFIKNNFTPEDLLADEIKKNCPLYSRFKCSVQNQGIYTIRPA